MSEFTLENPALIAEEPAQEVLVENPVVVAEEPVEEMPVENSVLVQPDPEPEVVEQIVTGRVVECAKLNVREKPLPNAAILGVLIVGSLVVIDEEESTTNFYKVCTESGLEGYCAKEYVRINPTLEQ